MKIHRSLFFFLALATCGLRADEGTDIPLPTDAPQAVALYQACVRGDLDAVKDLVQSGAPLDGQVGKGRYTPLMGAAYKAHLDVVKFLIDHRANLNLGDFEGSTALLHACWEDNADCALAIIDGGADVNIGSQWKRTPLMYAANRGDDRIVQDLISHKVNLDANCNAGPAIAWAAGSNHLSTVKLLGDADANVNLAAEAGRPDDFSILGCAAKNGNPELIDYLISKGADVNGTVAGEGRTPIMATIEFNRADALQELIAHGADVNKPNSDGLTPLMLGAGKARRDLLEILANARANLDATDSRGETALTMAGDIGQADVVQILKDKGAKRTDVHIILKPSPPHLPARSWALCVGAIYAQRAGFNPNMLGWDAEADEEKRMLKRDWNITDNASLLRELDDLRDGGHHAAYQKEGAVLAALPDDQFAKALAGFLGKEAKATALRASYVKWKDRTGLAWDMVRSANLVNAGYTAGYLQEQEAWDRLLEIARTAQKAFASWQELSDNFLDGREIWAGKRDPNFQMVTQLLLNPKDPNSPWTKSAWTTDLSAK